MADSEDTRTAPEITRRKAFRLIGGATAAATLVPAAAVAAQASPELVALYEIWRAKYSEWLALPDDIFDDGDFYNTQVEPAADRLADFNSYSIADIGIHARFLIEDGVAGALAGSDSMERVLVWILERLGGVEAVQS